ncbi:MAG: hypothetical protein IPM51_13615 [Sphingobacteriaceae bacterium]|nr:hypothetical protein [Sphingobacteriaceae bacterium]
MSSTTNKEEFFDLQFATQVNSSKQNGELILAYDGVLNTETIAKLEAEIESKIMEKGFPKSVVKKVFFICVESLQNMLIHGHRDDSGDQHNFFLLHSTPTAVKITVANLINNSSIEKLEKDLTKINSFENPADLKQYYLDHLENNELSDKGGAGLGFITIGMKSGNKLAPEFKAIDDKFSLFLMGVTINLE